MGLLTLPPAHSFIHSLFHSPVLQLLITHLPCVRLNTKVTAKSCWWFILLMTPVCLPVPGPTMPQSWVLTVQASQQVTNVLYQMVSKLSSLENGFGHKLVRL
jgi:hypothetical protein